MSSGLRWPRTAATGFALLFGILIIYGWTRNLVVANFTDYVSFWAAGKLALQGSPADAYDFAVHRAAELTVVQVRGAMPFPYPPPFLLLVTPFSLVPYLWGFAGWVVVTGAFYAYVSRHAAPLPYNLAHPPVLMNGLIGQNGFLTAGIFISGTALLRDRPFLAGAILGTLIIKPQLALLLPVAVVAARQWRAVAGAALSGGALLLLALMVFGKAAYEGFVEILPLYTEMMRQDKFRWSEFISAFAFVRYLGVDPTAAMIAQAVVAAGAIAITWIAWSRDWQEKVPVLAAATLLVPPYLLTYDSMLLIVPIGYWLRQTRRLHLVTVTWFLCVLPIAFYFNLYRGPNTVPLAAIFVLCAIVWERRRRAAHVNDANLVGVDALPVR
jgi:alpha-1,2-mannosyltransferase